MKALTERHVMFAGSRTWVATGNEGKGVGVLIRDRRHGDIPRLAALVESLRESDGYPPHWSPGRIERFVTSERDLAALVGEDDGVVVGHASVHDYAARSVMDLASEATGVAPAGLAAIARLFVHPGRRERGFGRQLLEATTDEARRLGRLPILDVWNELHRAVALYDSAGWHCLGEVTIEFGSPCTALCSHSDRSIRSFVYAGPGVA